MITCFAPIIDNRSETLILGTIPGVESLNQQFYYANQRNQFWDILARVLITNWHPLDLACEKLGNDDKRKLLSDRRLSLWDVIACCEREGSSDARIRNEQINDFETFFGRYPRIERVIFNGNRAQAFYKKRYGANTFGREMLVVNSTSTTNPNNTFYILKEWNTVLNGGI